MGPNPSLMLFVSLLLVGLASSSSHISYHAMEPSSSEGRNLLIRPKFIQPCSINFDVQDYGVMINKCKGPNYAPKLCCGAFKQFTCPFIDQVNDPTTDCSKSMFRNINLHFPAGLFSEICVEGPKGLHCPP